MFNELVRNTISKREQDAAKIEQKLKEKYKLEHGKTMEENGVNVSVNIDTDKN